MNEKYNKLRSFRNLCRICLLKEGQLTIFSLVMHQTKEVNIRQTLEFCTGSLVEDSDELPNHVCSDCFFELLKTYKFISKCRQSYDILQDAKALNEYVGDDVIEAVFDGSPAELKSTEKLRNKREKRKFVTIKKKHKQMAKQNLISHTKTKSFLCEVCSARFFRSSGLYRHMQIHAKQKRFVCNLCNRGFTTKCIYEDHMNEHLGKKPYLCAICGTQFTRYAKYYLHQQIHSEKPVNKQSIPCNVCPRVSSSEKAYKAHLLIHGEKNLKCECCDAKFSSKLKYRNHLRTHSGIRPYSCFLCKKGFLNYGTWKNHQRRHTGERPYKCDICLKSFMQSSHLRNHMFSHTKLKSFVCSYCGKCFSHIGYLTVHTRYHTGERPYVCCSCGADFFTSVSLRKHENTHIEKEV